MKSRSRVKRGIIKIGFIDSDTLMLLLSSNFSWVLRGVRVLDGNMNSRLDRDYGGWLLETEQGVNKRAGAFLAAAQLGTGLYTW